MMRVLAPLLFCALAGLTGCDTDNLTRTIGLTRDPPDEFQVTTRAPLSMPPDYTLRPPVPGASRPQELPIATQAEAALVPDAVLTNTAPASPGERALTAAAGPAVPPDIRREVDRQAQLDRPGNGLADKLLFWQNEKAGTVIDPTRESVRLRRDAALGTDPKAGNTPIVQPKPASGLLDSLF